MKSLPQTTSFRRGRLPHWEVTDGRYFVTICQHGAIPLEAESRIRALKIGMEKLIGGALFERQRAILREMELWLDRKDAPGDLTHPELAPKILAAIDHRATTNEWLIHAAVLMPNHLHLFIEMCQGDLFDSLFDFKRWIAREANHTLKRKGQFWARDWFDHWSRSTDENKRIIQYIHQNPVKANLCSTPKDWPYSR